MRRRKTSSAKREVELEPEVQGGGSRPGGWGRLPLTQLVKVRLGALRPRDGAHQAGLEERAPAVDEAALPSDVVLPGNESCTQPSPAKTPPGLSPQRDTRAPRSDSPSLAPRPAVGCPGVGRCLGSHRVGQGTWGFLTAMQQSTGRGGNRAPAHQTSTGWFRLDFCRPPGPTLTEGHLFTRQRSPCVRQGGKACPV